MAVPVIWDRPLPLCVVGSTQRMWGHRQKGSFPFCASWRPGWGLSVFGSYLNVECKQQVQALSIGGIGSPMDADHELSMVCRSYL